MRRTGGFATAIDNTYLVIQHYSKSQMEDAILSVLKGIVREKGDDDDAGKGKTIKVKSLRKMVLLSLRQDESDKSSKKEFKKAVQALHSDEKLVLNSEGLISPIIKKSKKRKSKDGVEEKLKKQKKGVDDVELKSKRKKKRVDSDKKQSQSSDSRATQTTAEGLDDEGNEEENEKEEAISAGGDASILKGVPCKGNPQGITRLFIGNLPFAVDEASLKAFIPGVTHIKVGQLFESVELKFFLFLCPVAAASPLTSLYV